MHNKTPDNKTKGYRYGLRNHALFAIYTCLVAEPALCEMRCNAFP
jgi:hypothetical protein